MIKLLSHTKINIAKEIYRVFQVSYPYEAKLLGVTSFPPLNRTKTDFQESTTLFYGYHEGESLAAVMELDVNENHTLIRSLIVDPAFILAIFFNMTIFSSFSKYFKISLTCTIPTISSLLSP